MLAYSAIIILAIASAAVIMRITQRDLELSRTERAVVGMGAFCGAMIGAKLPFVFSQWSTFISGAAWFSDGKTILLGLAGGYAGVEVAKWCLQTRTRTGDSFAVPVAVAVAIGRLGCFVGGCCYGVPTNLPWGVVFPSFDALPRHPAQLYEFIFHATAALLLAVCLSRNWFRGNLIKLYLISYATYRFFSEFIRPEIRFTAGLTGYQWASLVMALCFVWLWWRDAKRPAAAAIPRTTLQSN
jgi:phosphatidylglycerol---prolipoprotein diacylglyceryl transferase